MSIQVICCSIELKSASTVRYTTCGIESIPIYGPEDLKNALRYQNSKMRCGSDIFRMEDIRPIFMLERRHKDPSMSIPKMQVTF